MRETRSSGSVRGASGDGRPYRERVSSVVMGLAEGLLTEPTADTQVRRWEPVHGPLDLVGCESAVVLARLDANRRIGGIELHDTEELATISTLIELGSMPRKMIRLRHILADQ